MTSFPMYHASLSMLAFTVESLQQCAINVATLCDAKDHLLTQLCNKYHHVDTFRAHGDMYRQTQCTLYSVNALCCYKEICNVMKEIQSDNDVVGVRSDKLLLDGT